MNINTREIITDILYTLETEDRKSHLLIREVLEKYDYLDRRDKAFIKRVSEGTITNRITLDYVLDKYAGRPMHKCKPYVRVILRMSAYQLLFMDKVPKSAVCDEAVKLCRKKSFEAFCPFVNGILRNLSKETESALDLSSITDETERLSIAYSMPDWIVRMFKKEQKDAEGLLKALTDIRPTCVHITDETREEELLKKFEACGITFKKSSLIPCSYLLENFEGAESLPGFDEGLLLVEDESSQLAAMASGIHKGDDLKVIDVCAAPGGKSCFMASLMYPKGSVRSFDISDKKVSLIAENAERLSLSNITAEVKDATVYDESLLESADIVLCDVPCSGLGVLGRKSDLRYNISNESMAEICRLQKEIVSNASKYVKKGGRLVYSTCTIHKAENEKMVKFILENLPFTASPLKEMLPGLFSEDDDASFIQLLPDVHGTDGFFIAAFTRNEES